MSLIAWPIYLIWYLLWLRRKKPYKRFKEYEFPGNGFVKKLAKW